MEAGYLGSVSHRLEGLRAVNESFPGTVGSVNSRAPYPTFGRIQLVDNGGNANYNSMSVKLTKRFTRGLTVLGSYTYAKSIDNSSGIRVQDDDTLFPQNSYCMQCERALSAFDTRHRFVASGLYDIPVGKGRMVNIENRILDGIVGGWQTGIDRNRPERVPDNPHHRWDRPFGNGHSAFDRPNATGISPYIDSPTTSRWFNLAAFAVAPAGQLGNAAASPSSDREW